MPRNKENRWNSNGFLLAEDTRFELVRLLHQHAFQACAIDH